MANFGNIKANPQAQYGLFLQAVDLNLDGAEWLQRSPSYPEVPKENEVHFLWGLNSCLSICCFILKAEACPVRPKCGRALRPLLSALGIDSA